MQDLASHSVLVTGGSGFLGAELVHALLANGVSPQRLRCLLRSPQRGAAARIPAECVRVGDVTEPSSLAAAVAGVDLVLHLAGTLKATGPAGYAVVNAVGTANLVAAVRTAAPAAHFLLVSSLAAAGPSIDGVGSDRQPDACRPVSAYGASKRDGELVVARSALRWTIVRPPIVYGPGDPATELLFRQACAPLCAAPIRARPLSAIHVRDVVAALLAAARVRPHGAVLPLEGPERTDTHALLRAIAAACGRRARLLPVPMPIAGAVAAVADLWARLTGRASFFNGDKVRELRAPGWVADASAARRELGWTPRIALAEGLAEVALARRSAARG